MRAHRFCSFLLRLAHICCFTGAALVFMLARQSLSRTIPFFLAFIAAALATAEAVTKLAIRQFLDKDRRPIGQRIAFGDDWGQGQPILRTELR